MSFHNLSILKRYLDFMDTQMNNHVQESTLNAFKKELEKESVASTFKNVKEKFKHMFRISSNNPTFNS